MRSETEQQSGKDLLGKEKLSTREFARRATIAISIGLVLIGLVALVGFSLRTWFAAALGILIAIFVRTISDWIAEHSRISPTWSAVLVLFGLIGLVVLGSWLLARPLAEELQELGKRVPEALATLRQKAEDAGLERFIPSQLPSGSEIAAAGSAVVSQAMSVFSVTFNAAAAILMVLFLGVYLAISPDQYVDGVISLFPPAKRSRTRVILNEIGSKLRRWITGQIISMIVVGGLIALGLYLTGVPLALTIGIIAGLLDIIPIFGPILAAIPAILLGFTVSPLHALYAVLVFVAANQIEEHVLIPVIQRYSVSLPPALTAIALFLMGSLFGFWGLLLAAPLTAVALLVIKRVYIGEILKDETALRENDPPEKKKTKR